MQSAQEVIASAGVQTPLLDANQLQVGALLTGIAMAKVWRVKEIAATELLIHPIEASEWCNGEHAFAAFGRGRVCSRCQARWQGIPEFLPLRENKPRVHVIVPASPDLIQIPQPFTVYGGLKGTTVELVHLLPNGQWNTPVPPYVALLPVWSIPESLRALVGTAPAEVDPSDIEF